jgi:hypothetical protein
VFVVQILSVCDEELLGMIPTASVVSQVRRTGVFQENCALFSVVPPGAQEAVGNALISGVSTALNVTSASFKAAHPGGTIGKK